MTERIFSSKIKVDQKKEFTIRGTESTSKYHEISENSTPDKISSSPPIFLEEVLDVQKNHPTKKKKLSNVKDAILRIGHYPKQWKMSHIIVIDKPGKPPHEILSYHPISLLPIFSKIFEKLLLKCIESILKETNLIPDHQFAFRKQHLTIQQIHRLVDHIRKDLEDKRYFSAIFLDIKQAFDKVWYSGIFYKK
ncbi:hypothetical protein HZH68_014668 [Vespula germanica]|uniref:Reverse transcriptase domain-containing protein n=1 Tax=Vespula germanica TaxID=30212 RepID=A0A834JE11_VESGE|nr:hypothetical protein HZH68_014668 [Vespula germanica]